MSDRFFSNKYEILFIAKGKYITLADADDFIFAVHDSENRIHYCDSKGNSVAKKQSYEPHPDPISDDPWSSEWIKDEGLDEPLISESTTEEQWEIDDVFGNYGYKNQKGEFVIEPQYASAQEFTCGLAAVNLNRTWYRTVDGKRYYENHYGYINGRGQTVIPFAYDEAWPFNQYGVAVVRDLKRSYLIDTNGQKIKETEQYDFYHYYDYDTRFLQISMHTDEYIVDPLIGIYDTKERKVILEPSVDDALPLDDDIILLYNRDGEYGASDFHEYYINSKGEILFPWLYRKGFAEVSIPNKHLNAIVSVSKYLEVGKQASNYIEANGKKYSRSLIYGVYSSSGEMLVPLEYDSIKELAENIYSCKKGEVITVIKML